MSKFEKMVSPIGSARYAYLHVPSDKFTPIYKVDLIVSEGECVEFREQLDKKNQEAYEKAYKEHPKDRKLIKMHPPYTVEVDEDGSETGNIIFKFKGSPTFQKKDGSIVEKKIKAFDSRAKAIQMPAVYSGSTIRVEFTPVSYYNPSNKTSGISLRILSVQILDLVTFDSDGKSRGYDEMEEYSYVGNADAVKATVTALADSSASANEEDTSRRKLQETVITISKEEGVEESKVLYQLTQDRNGYGGVADIEAIQYQATRLDGTTYSPLMTALSKAEKRLAAAGKVPF